MGKSIMETQGAYTSNAPKLNKAEGGFTRRIRLECETIAWWKTMRFIGLVKEFYRKRGFPANSKTRSSYSDEGSGARSHEALRCRRWP